VPFNEYLRFAPSPLRSCYKTLLRRQKCLSSYFNLLSMYYFLGNDRPELGDLFIHVIPQNAPRWEALGAVLGLKDYEIDVISKDNPNRSTEACTAMLMKWLQSVNQPTWGELVDAIDLLKSSQTTDDYFHVRGTVCADNIRISNITQTKLTG